MDLAKLWKRKREGEGKDKNGRDWKRETETGFGYWEGKGRKGEVWWNRKKVKIIEWDWNEQNHTL